MREGQTDLLEKLNDAQREAVSMGDGPALVLAGPGSGKTRVLTHRIAYLVGEMGIRPWNIVAVTFTNKAAREMKERLLHLLGPRFEDLSIGTFHSICARILRPNSAALGYAPSFTIYDTDDQLLVVKRVLKEMGIDEKVHKPGAVLNHISNAKNDLILPEHFHAKSYDQEIAGRVYPRYQQALRESNAMDFDDLLMNVVLLFRQQPEVLERYQRRYTYVLVDEFQDTNLTQYALLNQLAGAHRNLFVVADEDQSIYSWRGADYRNIQRFREDFPEAKVILLERNYRSTQTILDAANAVISRNAHRTPKSLYTDRGKGPLVSVYEAYDEQEEGQYVVQEIQRLVGEGLRPGDCAVMYRTNAQSRAIEEAFVRAGQPYKLVGATRFYERREIKDALAYLRILYNPADSVSLNRVINVPPRGLGQQTLATLFSWASALGCSVWEALHILQRESEKENADLPFGSRAVTSLLNFLQLWTALHQSSRELGAGPLLEMVLQRTGYEAYLRDGSEEGDDRWDNVAELLAVASQYSDMDDSLGTFLEEVSLVSDVDDLGEQPDAPVLLTLHMAKGLEFPVVFIVGLEEGMLPHSRSSTSVDELEEERRLCYVGITRAKDRLVLVHAFRRATYGRSDVCESSRFLRDIPRSLTDRAARPVTRPAARPGLTIGEWRRHPTVQRPVPQAESSKPNGPVEQTFFPGDKVRHPLFGEGTVVQSALLDSDEEVSVAFPGKGVKRLLASFARLEKV